MKKSEKEAINILEKAFKTKGTYMYTFLIQDYFADENNPPNTRRGILGEGIV